MTVADGGGGVTAAAILGALGHAVIATDPEGVVTYWNGAAERMYGWSAAEAIGAHIGELTVPDQMQEFAAEIMAALGAGQAWSGVFTVRRRDGSRFAALVTDTALHDGAGRLLALVGVSVAVERAVEPFLRRSREAVVVTDREGVVRMASPVIATVTGWTVEGLTGQEWWGLVHPEDRPAAHAAHAHTLAGPGLAPPVEHRLRTPDGSWLWVETAETNLLDEPAVRGILLTLRDVGQRHARVAELTHRALHDSLTGLVNRAVFMDRLQSHVAGRHHGGAVLYVDLDGFKAVNDWLGHLAGDRVLREVADRLRASVRPGDVCGRLGGDEFAVLAPDITEPRQALALVRRCTTCLSRPVEVDGAEVEPAASVGVAMLADADDADEAISLADRNMYERKRRRTAARRRLARDRD